MESQGTLAEFETPDNFRLEGFLHNAKSKTALIHLHGMNGFFWSNIGLNIFDVCKKLEIGGFIINTRGKGIVTKLKSTISKDKDVIFGTSFEIFEDCIHDINGAINFLKNKGYENFILSGHSTGCQKIIYYALNETVSNIQGLICLAPGDDLNLMRNEENFKKEFKYAKENYDSKVIFSSELGGSFSAKRFYDLVKDDSTEGNLFNYKSDLDYLKKIKIPILTIFGKDEEYALIPPQEMLNKISKNYMNNKSYTALISGNHGFTDGEEELKAEIEKWIKSLS